MVSRLKGAAIDLGVAQIDRVRDVVSPRLVANLERLPIVLQGPVRELASGRPVSELTLDGIRTVGIGFLERIEAMLDHPSASREKAHKFDEGDDESEDESDCASTGSSFSHWSFEGAMIATRQICVPRILPLHRLRTYAMQLSNSATLKITVLCMQDTASAVMQRLRVQDAVMKRLFDRFNCGEEAQVANTASAFAVTAFATRFAYMGCERVLGEGLAAALFGRKRYTNDAPHHSAGLLTTKDGIELELIEVPEGTADDDCLSDHGNHPATNEGAGIASSLANKHHGIAPPEVTATASLSNTEPMEFRLIVKNSFIEFDEPPPSELRRVHSWETIRSFGHSRCLNSEPFTIYARIVKPPDPSPSSSSTMLDLAQTSNNDDCPLVSAPLQEPTHAKTSMDAITSDLDSITCKPFKHPEESTIPLPAIRTTSPPGLVPMPLAINSEAHCQQSGQPDELAASLSAEAAAVGADLADVLGSARAEEERGRTTVMLRNVPTSFSRDELLCILDRGGFQGHYDFVYLPVDFTRNIGLGYALISLVSPFDAELLLRHFDGFEHWGALQHGNIPCEASWSEPRQALHEHIERYRNSPVMHKSVPDAYKPALFEKGARVAFPPPTKTLRPPRIRHLKTID